MAGMLNAGQEADAFLAEYEALCIKHDILLGGCGCCGSPWLVRAAAYSHVPTADGVARHIAELREELGP